MIVSDRLLGALLLAGTSHCYQAQRPLVAPLTQGPHVKQIAIIGAGSAGASTAYFLRQYARNASIPINITIFERNDYIGGRSTTVHPYDDPLSPPLELGASIFVQVNHNLVEAAAALNLSTTSYKPQLDPASALASAPALGVWDGTTFVYEQVQDSLSFWDLAKLVWRYGLAPYRTQKLMKSVVGNFLQMYEAPFFPFSDLTDVVGKVGLLDAMATNGETFMVSNGIRGEFAHDIVQASTRVNYATNLNRIHGVETMVCMAAEGAMSVRGGNWQIFDGMVKRSHAQVTLGARVSHITRGHKGQLDVTVDRKKQRDSSRSVVVKDEGWTAAFDDVVLAAPDQFANIEWADGIRRRKPDAVPYVSLHVTLFTSKHKLDPVTFGLRPTELVPRAVLTTTRKENETAGDSSPDFFSISVLHEVENKKTGVPEYAYKIFTPTAVSDQWLAHILGLGAVNERVSSEEISWIYRKVWNSYPVELPRVTFEDISLGDHVWYTAGMESFISTMETSSLMGKNVARLIVDRFQADMHATGGKLLHEDL